MKFFCKNIINNIDNYFHSGILVEKRQKSVQKENVRQAK